MAQRVAFLIGNQTFRTDSDLEPLQGPQNDIAALAPLLRDPERGNFEIHEFLDKPRQEIMRDIAEALDSAASGDLVLIYYSGHGMLDRGGRLCLATADTHRGAGAALMTASSIPARHLSDLVESSDCDQVVLVLDCCFSGAVKGLRGDVGSALQVVEEAHGFSIVTATTSMQATREEAPSPGGVVMGKFTAALVKGIKTGAADQGRKGRIMLSDLRHYLGQVAIGSTPRFFDHQASGDPLISLSPATAKPLLDVGMLADLNDEQWHRRLGAVSALSDVLRHGDAVTQAAARAALQRHLEQERDYSVRAQLELALGRDSVITPGVLRPPVPSVDPEKVEVPATTSVVSEVAPREHKSEAPKKEGSSGQPRPEPPRTKVELGNERQPIANIPSVNTNNFTNNITITIMRNVDIMYRMMGFLRITGSSAEPEVIKVSQEQKE